jgi:protein-S-isoprenylcysteine O-methyltransferase Ste14
MGVERHNGHERELPHAHIYHILLPIIFILVWFLDSALFSISTILNDFVQFIIRLPLFIAIFIIAIIFIKLSHRVLFKTHQPSDTLITNGILGHVRNPIYLGILLIYVAFLCLSISIISIAVFILIFLIYNKMVDFEENLLETMFGNEYLEYKNRVSKWIPKLFK